MKYYIITMQSTLKVVKFMTDIKNLFLYKLITKLGDRDIG